MNISNIKSNLYKAIEQKRPGRKIESLSRVYFKEILAFPTIEDEAIELLLTVLSDNNLFKNKNAELFLYQMYMSIGGASDEQKFRILNVILQNYRLYDREDMCFMSTDFIVRVFLRKMAFESLVKLARGIERKAQRSGILHGLDVLRINHKGDDEFVSKCRSLMAELARSKP